MNTSMLLLLLTFLAGVIVGIVTGTALGRRDWRLPYERPRLDPYRNERLGARFPAMDRLLLLLLVALGVAMVAHYAFRWMPL